MTRVYALLIFLLAVVCSFGCGNREFLNENDELRAQVVQLEQRVREQRLRNEELEAKLAQARQQAEVGDPSPEVADATPRVVDISIGRLSHVRDLNDDGVFDTFTVYVSPVDGRGRFTQMAGTMTLHAIVTPAGGDAITIGREQFSPGAVRDAYRSGITGTHYTFQLSIDLSQWNRGDLPNTVIVNAKFEDGLTGQTHDAQRAIELNRRLSRG